MNIIRFYLLLHTIVFFLFHFFNHNSLASDIFIGVACPLSETSKIYGDAMLKGINLYVDEMNKNAFFARQKIKLIIKDDKNDKQAALKVAKEFASDDRILLVIGHYFSSTSFVAGRIYRTNGIPAITASATADNVTYKNDWYFRVIPNNSFQSYYIANYIKSHLKIKRVNIINDQDEYGTDLAATFEKTAKELGIEIENKYILQSFPNGTPRNIKNIIQQLIQIDDSSALFIAAHTTDSIYIINSLQKKGKKFNIIGADSFGTDSFIIELSQLNSSIKEYTNNIHFVTPFMPQVTNKESLMFLNKYSKTYGHIPYWIAAIYYDAICVAVNAINASQLNENENIYSKRNKIKESLKHFYSYDNSIKGVTGNIFFDKNGNSEQPLVICLFQKNKPVPSYAQYDLIPPHKIDNNTLEKTLNDEMIVINDKVFQKKRFVYAHIDLLNLDPLDKNDYSFKAKFYLYFKFFGDFDDNNIIFTNSTKPISLSSPVTLSKNNSIMIKKYLVEGNFYYSYDLQSYPFDDQTLHISFHHKKLTNDKLVYVSDTTMIENSSNKLSCIGWKMKNQITYQDILENTIESKITASVEPIIFSQLNTVFTMKRDRLINAFLQFIPLIVLVLIPFTMVLKSYIQSNYFIPVLSVILILTACYHYFELLELNIQYILFIEFFIFIYYIIIIGSIIVSYQVINDSQFISNHKLKVYRLFLVMMYSIFFGTMITLFIIKRYS